MQVNTVEKLASVGAFGLWAALHGWLGWLAVLYAICMLLDCVTGTALAVKEKTWNSSKARKGLWHKGGSTIDLCKCSDRYLFGFGDQPCAWPATAV